MAVLKNPNISHILKITFFTKILVLVFLSWIYQYNYNKCTIVKSLKNGSRIDTCLGRNTNRLLAKHRDESELQRIGLQNKANDKAYKHKLSNGNESSNIYGHLKQNKLNNVDTYLKNYKSRYAKKKGLKKFDCFYEKELFKSMEKIEKITQQKNITKKRIKKIIYKKYGIRFILLSLLPLFGLILPIMYYNTDHIKKKCIKLVQGSQKKFVTYWHKNCEILPPEYRFSNFFFFTALGLIIILFIIYTYVKILKYKRIKSGMQK